MGSLRVCQFSVIKDEKDFRYKIKVMEEKNKTVPVEKFGRPKNYGVLGQIN